jgi:hypothetical protein
VDEFQNFATTSFIKILSEARKYRLGLVLANQYLEQIGEEILAAVKGNAGTLVNFLVGIDDAKRLVGEYGGLFDENDLVGLGRGEVVVKLAIDGLTSRAFFARTLLSAASKNQNRDKVINVSRERWAKKIEDREPKTEVGIQGLDSKSPQKQKPDKEQKYQETKESFLQAQDRSVNQTTKQLNNENSAPDPIANLARKVEEARQRVEKK